MNNRIILGIGFLILGVLSLLSGIGITHLTFNEIIGIVLVAYSIPTVYNSFNTGERGKLVFATVLFMMGIIFLTKSYYEILDTRGLVLVSILFITGSVFLILFIENMKEKIFLVPALVCFILSYLSITRFEIFGLFNAANKLGNLVEVFWPVMLTIMGMIIFINRKK